MAAVGDVYQIVDVSQYEGQQVLNVYFYKRTAEVLVGNPAQQVADTFEASMLPSILGIQSSDILHTEIRVQNLFDVTDEYTKSISETGSYTSTGDTEAAFDAIGFRLVQDNGAIRNGAKRYGGIADSGLANGVVTDAGLITALLALGVALVTGLDIGIVSNAVVPVIVKRILDGGSYRLPTNSGEAVVGNITEALYNVNETSQTSRKIGRGI